MVAVWVLCLADLLALLVGGTYGQPSAVLFGDQLVVAVNETRQGKYGHLLRGRLDQQVFSGPPVKYLNPTFGLPFTTQAKLELQADRLLVFRAGAPHAIVPLADLQLLELSDLGHRLCHMRGYQSVLNYTAERRGVNYLLLFPPNGAREPDVPVVRRFGFGGGADRDPEYVYTESARYDVQLHGDKTVRLFHAHKDKLFVSIEPDYLRHWYLTEPKPKEPKKVTSEDRELRTGALPANFTEHFAAYTADAGDFLVTTTGKVYLCAPKDRTEVTVTKVWDDPKRRIVGVVQDEKPGAVYGWGFVGASVSPERFFVKLTPKPVAVAYNRTAPLSLDRTDAYLESYECSRAFRKDTEKK